MLPRLCRARCKRNVRLLPPSREHALEGHENCCERLHQDVRHTCHLRRCGLYGQGRATHSRALRSPKQLWPRCRRSPGSSTGPLLLKTTTLHEVVELVELLICGAHTTWLNSSSAARICLSSFLCATCASILMGATRGAALVLPVWSEGEDVVSTDTAVNDCFSAVLLLCPTVLGPRHQFLN